MRKWLQLDKQMLLFISTIIIAFSYAYIDRPLSQFFYDNGWISHSWWMHRLTDLGLGGPYIIGLILCCAYFWYQRQYEAFKQASFVFASMLSAAVVVDTLKIIFSRARPKLLFNDGLYGFHWFHLKAKFWSFPSGHTTVLVSVAFSLGILYPRYRKYLLVAAGLLSFTRVMVLAHYLSDIMAATLISVLVVSALKAKYDQGAFDKLITKSKALARS